MERREADEIAKQFADFLQSRGWNPDAGYRKTEPAQSAELQAVQRLFQFGMPSADAVAQMETLRDAAEAFAMKVAQVTPPAQVDGLVRRILGILFDANHAISFSSWEREHSEPAAARAQAPAPDLARDRAKVQFNEGQANVVPMRPDLTPEPEPIKPRASARARWNAGENVFAQDTSGKWHGCTVLSYDGVGKLVVELANGTAATVPEQRIKRRLDQGWN